MKIPLYDVRIGTIGLIVCLCVFIYAIREQVTKDIEQRIDTLLLFALLLRIIWMIVVVFLEEKMQFFVYDDETYYHVAMGSVAIADGDNFYNYILRFIYDVFGKTSLNGRLTNMFASIATIYPLAYLEKSLNEETKFGATTFFAVSPFQVFISFFEIKDIILMFAFVSSYAVLNSIRKRGRISVALIIQIAILCAISEGIRSGMGIIPIAILLFDRVRRGIGANRIQRIVSGIVLIGAFALIVWIYFQDYILSQSVRVEKYQKWIFTQFGSTSFYNKFVVTGIQDVWKLPFCFVLYALQPLNALDGYSRFFGEWGMFAKIIDVPILVMAIRWLYVYVKKEKIYSLIFILPYIFVSGVNLTNARQGFFLYPIMYLMCFYGFSRMDGYNGKSSIIRIINSSGFTYLLVGTIYVLWLFVIIMRA